VPKLADDACTHSECRVPTPSASESNPDPCFDPTRTVADSRAITPLLISLVRLLARQAAAEAKGAPTRTRGDEDIPEEDPH
jgi:hypothetical protein